MKITRFDAFFIGLNCAFIFINFFNKDFIALAIQGFIIGFYFSFSLGIDKFTDNNKGEKQ